ncbi:MAG: hypothetical protein J6U54_13275 [Clostridiales bacterium]|nr:hypothetical protein [Clostridiales bacterium]
MARGNVITIEDTKLILKNFAGKADKYNAEGRRSFGVLISPETAADFEDAGIPVKYLQPRHEEDEPIPWVKVKINMDRENPPKIYEGKFVNDKITIDEDHPLTKDSISMLDYSDLDYVSVQLSVYDWEFGGKSGKALYLQNMVYVLNEDDFLSKYKLNDVD